MAYIGQDIADVAVTVGQGVIDASHIVDSSITTVDIGNDAITANKIDDDGTGFQMGSLGLGTTVSGSHKLTVGGTATFSGDITGTLATASQTNITGLGTITTGVWQGTKVASAYLDDDTAHLSGTQTFTGAKTFTANPIIQSDTGTLNFYNAAGTQRAFLQLSTTGLIIDTDSFIELKPNNTRALYINDLLDATFSGTVTVGASNGSEEVKANRTRVRHIDGLADASDYSHGDLYVNHISTGNIYMQRATTFANNVTVDGDRYMLTESGTNKGFFGKDDWATSGGSADNVNVGSYSGTVKITAGAGSSSTSNIICNTDKSTTFSGAASFVGMNTTSMSGSGFRTIHASTTTKYTSLAYDGLYTAGAQHQYISSAQDIKFYPGGTNEVTFADGGLATFAGSITSGTHLIQGVSNYTGLEVKGSGGSRPQIKWSNVNNGVMGAIYGTESNGLVIGSGTSNTTAMTISSGQEVTMALGVKFEANKGSTVAKMHWFHFNTTGSYQYYHWKTDITWGNAAQMYSLGFTGYAYNDTKPIDCTLGFYNYDNGNVLAIGSHGTHSLTVYKSNDDKIVIRLDLTAGGAYYSGGSISQYNTQQGLADFNITGTIHSNNTADYA